MIQVDTQASIHVPESLSLRAVTLTLVCDKMARHQSCHNLLLFIKTNHRSFSFCYIPGHVGFSPHDVADAYARKASYYTSVDLVLNLKYHKINDIIDKHFTHEWLNNYNFSDTGKEYLRFFHPPFHSNNLVFNKHRRKEIIYHRRRLQYCKNNYYLFKIGAVDSPMCDLCILSDTVEHMLIECFKHTTLHIELKIICKAINKPYNVTTLLSKSLLFNVIFLYISANNISI